MRTTLDIDDDVLGAVKELAAAEKRSAGKVLSELARKALGPAETGCKTKNGFPQIPGERRLVTSELVQQLLDDADFDSIK